MGEFQERSQVIYERLLEELDDRGYENLNSEENNKIADLIMDHHLEDMEAFKELINDAEQIIKDMRL